MDNNEVYYKIYKSKQLSNKLTVICMQWFDETDYESERFFRDRGDNILKFCDEGSAINWLLYNIKEELIDEEYLVQRIIIDEEYYKQ